MEKKTKIIAPEFIIIPYILIDDDKVSPVEEKLYGIIYWFSQLKREKCTASNPVLASLVKTSIGSIQNSLTNLEANGYIKRTFSDKNRRNRQEIIPLIVFSKVSPTDDRDNQVSPTGDMVSPTGDRQVSPTGEENKNNINKNNKEEGSNAEALRKVEEMILKYIPIKDIKNKTNQRYLSMLYNSAEKDISQIEFLCKGVEYFKKSAYPYTIYSARSLYEKKEKILARMEQEQLKVKNSSKWHII